MPVKCESPCLPSPEGRGEVTLQMRKKDFTCSLPTTGGYVTAQYAESGLDNFSEQLTQDCISAGGAGTHRLVELNLLSPFRASVSTCKVRISESQRIGGCLPVCRFPHTLTRTCFSQDGLHMLLLGLAWQSHSMEGSSRNAALALGRAGGELGGCCVTGFTTPLGQPFSLGLHIQAEQGLLTWGTLYYFRSSVNPWKLCAEFWVTCLGNRLVRGHARFPKEHQWHQKKKKKFRTSDLTKS